MTKGELAFQKKDRGFGVSAWYDADDKCQDAIIEITRDGQPLRSFTYPAYRIWNIAAHFRDMVDDFLVKARSCEICDSTKP